jgi:hypothetical protein
VCGLSDKIYMEWVLHILKLSWSQGFSFYHVPPSVRLLPTWTIGFKCFRTCKKSLDYSYALLGPTKQDTESGRYDKYLVSPQLSDSDNLCIDMQSWIVCSIGEHPTRFAQVNAIRLPVRFLGVQLCKLPHKHMSLPHYSQPCNKYNNIHGVCWCNFR